MQKKILVISKGSDCEEIKGILAQISIPSESACSVSSVKKRLRQGDIACAIFDDDAFSNHKDRGRIEILELLKGLKKEFIFVTSSPSFEIIHEAKISGAKEFIVRPYNCREFILRVNACYYNKTKIACIGGGTGLFNLLLGLKQLPHILINSIVAMTDDGGSTGKLRESFGILPPGDVRRNLVALSNAPVLMNEVLQHRFKTGGNVFEGHSFGNLFLTVLAEIKGSMKEGIKSLGDILNIQGIVIPVTDNLVRLGAMFEDGNIVIGESKIDTAEGRHPEASIKKLWHVPKAETSIDAYASILNSDAVIIGPGDLFTSVITNLIVGHVAEAIVRTSAKKIYVCNLMTKLGETAHYGAFEHIKEIIDYLGGDYLDYVIISNTRFSAEALKRYKAKGQFPVEVGDLRKIKGITKARIVLADVAHETELVRHNNEKLKNVIGKVLNIRTA
jgi:uncharacterized cofD-like protein